MFTRSFAHPRSNKGFTISELLLTTLLGSILVLGVFSVFTTTSTYYTKQMELTQVQSTTRFAMEYLKSELRDIGRLSILNTHPDFRDPLYCGLRQYQGITLFDQDRVGNGGDPPEVLVDNQLIPDRLQVLVDASDATPLTLQSLNGNRATTVRDLDHYSLEARRMLSDGAEARFRILFDRHAFARITNLTTGRYDVVPVRSSQVQGGVAKIELSEAPCAQLNCNSGQCLINPIHWIEYAIIQDEDDRVHTHLVRRRLETNNGTPLPNQTLTLAFDVVNFQVWGDYDTRNQIPSVEAQRNREQTPPYIPQDQTLKDDRGNWGAQRDEGLLFKEWSHRLRGLNLLISTRGSRINYEFPQIDRQPGLGLQERTWFELNTDRGRGFTSVSALIGSVETPNLYRGN
jgi:hypothetical protein